MEVGSTIFQVNLLKMHMDEGYFQFPSSLSDGGIKTRQGWW